MQNTVKTCAERILDILVPAWQVAYAARVKQIIDNIFKDNSHPLHKYLTLIPSGRRLRQKGCAPRDLGHRSSHAQSACPMRVIRLIMYALPSICTNHVSTIVSQLYVCMLYHWQSKSITAIQIVRVHVCVRVRVLLLLMLSWIFGYESEYILSARHYY